MGDSSFGNVLLGFVFSLQNAELGIDLFGSPQEVCAHLAERGLRFGEVFDHVSSTVDVADVLQAQPLLRIHGGPHAATLTALLEALETGDAHGLAMNADVLRTIADGVHVPLLGAAARGEGDRVELLVKLGAIPDLPGDLGMSPLHWAAARGHREVASLLVGVGASQTAQNWFFLTPAELAAINGHPKVAEELGLMHLPPNNAWLDLTVERMRTH
jgi:Ankyrin repeats (3 copies)